jgi:hypothetical protein
LWRKDFLFQTVEDGLEYWRHVDPLDAAGWHALAGMHMGIHRAQIERILSGLCRE